MSLDESVDQIKTSIHDQLPRIPLDEQRLIYADKQLEDGRVLSHYKTREESFLHLVVRLRGGGSGEIPRDEMTIAAGGKIHQVVRKDILSNSMLEWTSMPAL